LGAGRSSVNASHDDLSRGVTAKITLANRIVIPSSREGSTPQFSWLATGFAD